MKTCLRSAFGYLQRSILVIISVFVSAISFAQDKSVDVNISTNKGNGFWGSPWVWVVGAAVFILLLVAILRGGSRRDA